MKTKKHKQVADYSVGEKLSLVCTVLDFPKEDANAVTKFCKALEIDHANGRHLYFAGFDLLDKFLAIGFDVAEIQSMNDLYITHALKKD